ncbi:MAG: hypothetical protein ACKO3N_17260, partial [Verrucomicrobiota bacterium]
LPSPAAHRFLLAATLFWGASWVRVRLAGFLENDSDLLALALLPIPEEAIFRRQLVRALVHLLPVPVAGILAGGLIAASVGAGSAWLPGLAGGLGLGMYLVGLGLAFLPWRSAPWFSSLGWALLFPGVFLVRMLPDSWRAAMLHMLGQYGDVLAALLPTGWAVEPFHHLLAGTARRADWAWALPIATLLVATPFLVRRYREQYRPREGILLPYAAQAPEWFDEEQRAQLQEALERPRSIGPTEIREAIVGRHFLGSALGPPPGWMERWAWATWTPRERIIAEWALGAWPGWTRSWHQGWPVLAVTGVVTGMLHGAGVDWAWMATALGGSVVGLRVLPLGTGLTGRALAPIALGQARFSPLGLFPVTLGEMVRLALKTSAVRGLAALPFGLLTGACVAWLFPDLPPVATLADTVGAGASLGAQACLLGVAGRPLLVIYQASQATQDSARLHWRSLPVALLQIVGALGGLALALASLIPYLGWAALLLLALFSLGFTALYLRFWNRSAFDLQPPA